MDGGTESAAEPTADSLAAESVADGRCGYTYEASTMADLGGACCWRPSWGDTGRCVWHADVTQKPTAALEESAADVGDRLDGAVFRDVELSGTAWLAGRTLVDAEFVDCSLEDADLSGADLRHAVFEAADAERASFRDADLEHAEFRRTDLRGAELSGARLRDADFVDARVDEATEFGDRLVYEDELADADDADGVRSDLYEAARWTYQEIQSLAADNGLTRASRGYYLRQKDLRRRLAWEDGSYARALAEEAWRWTTGYGTNPWRVIATSAAVIALCALLYPVTGGIQETADGVAITYTAEDAERLEWYVVLFKSLYFSTVTFATLGYGDIQPVGSVARAIAGLEAVTGQLLVALLVFVLTRNVTWSE